MTKQTRHMTARKRFTSLVLGLALIAPGVTSAQENRSGASVGSGAAPVTTNASSAGVPAATVFPFSIGSSIPLGPVSVWPVTLHRARFRLATGQLQTEVYAICAESEDQEVSVTLQLLDELGMPLATLNVRGGVEEEDHATLKARARVPERTLALVRSFTVQASTKPD